MITVLMVSCGGNNPKEEKTDNAKVEAETMVEEIENTASEVVDSISETPVLNEIDGVVDSIGNEIDNVIKDLK